MDQKELRALLYEKYIAPTKSERDEYTGIEIEMPILNLAKEAVDFTNVHRLTYKFIEHFGFTPVSRDEDGEVSLAEHMGLGDTLSYDCSYNNLELSFGREKSILEVQKRFNRYYAYIRECLAEYDYTLTGMGVNPYRIYNQNVPVPNGRYRMLFHHLHSYEKYRKLPMYFHPHPEFGTFSSASQVQLDVTFDEIPEVINTFSKLEPIKALIFSNSVLLGEAEDYLCIRDIFWENSTHGINPHNVGPYEYKFKDVDEFLDYISSMSIYCTERDDKYINFRPMPLREYFETVDIEGEYYQDGKYRKLIIQPEKDDLKYLRSFKFEDLTYRGTIEFRSVCCQPIKDSMCVAAFHAGLKKKLHELTKLLDEDKVIYGHGYNATELRRHFVKDTLPSFVDEDAVYSLAEEIAKLSKEGLIMRGYGEEVLLAPIFERIEKRENPAARMLKKLKDGVEIEQIIKEYAE